MLVELPDELSEALAKQFQGISGRQLGRTTRDLSARYRTGVPAAAPVARSDSDVVAYAAYRMPATYAADVAALAALREQREGWNPRTMLDLGTGLGSGAWAATRVWPSIEQITALDAQSRMIAVGRELARTASHPALRSVEWVHRDVVVAHVEGRYDLVLLSYVLGELNPARIEELIDRAWDVTDGALGVIEPGTPAGYARVILARDRLVAGGGFPVAPCPHDPPCAMGDEDWCHFSVRLPRSKMHRAAKGGTLGYEDEKFSYVAVSRAAVARTYSRVLRHPRVRGGHIYLQLCTPEGPRTVVISKRDKELYNRARKAAWGDAFDFPIEGG